MTNAMTLEKLNKLANEKGLKVKPLSYYYQLMQEKENSFVEIFTSDNSKLMEEIIEGLIKEGDSYTIKRYTHVWQSEDIWTDPEGYLRGQINGSWVDYNHAISSYTKEKPNTYRSASNIIYLGYLDQDSPIDQSCNYSHYD